MLISQLVFLLFVLLVGGSQNLRFYWNQYLSKAHILVFVVDSADGSRLHVARQELHCLLAEDPQLPLIVLANKQVSPLLSFTCYILKL